MAGANVPYTPYSTEQSSGNLGGGMGVAAKPEDFGSQVGAAIEKSGDSGFDVALKQQGMVNETMMTNADAALATKVGQIKGAYLQNTGLAASAAYPQYQADLEAARQEARANLPPAAAHGFDMLSMRTIANHIADGSTYAAGQVRQANIDAGTNLTNANVQAVLDPNAASDPSRVQYHQDSAIHGLQMTLDENHPGLKTDPETGTVSFDDSTPAGRALKSNYEAAKDNIITQVQTNRFDTLAKGDVLGAFGIYQQERDTFPRPTQVRLDATFEPKVFNANVQNASSSVIADSEQDHAKLLYNPDSSKSAIDTVLKNEGGLSKDGHAIYGIDKIAHPEEFAQAQKITDENGVAAGQDYARQFYKTQYWDKKDIQDLPVATQAVVMDGIVNHYPEFGDKLIAAAKNGVSPQTLISMRRDEYQRLATTNPEKYGENLSGWNNRLDSLQGANPYTGEHVKSYTTNPDGSMLTTADYYRTHSEDVLQRADAQSEKDMPGDLAYKRAMRETVSNYMSKVISNQSAQYTMDNKQVMRAIGGELTNGKAPETEQELRDIPGMGDMLDRVAAQDPKFAEGIPTMIAKVARGNDTTNSANGYATIMRTLEPHGSDNPNAISRQDQLDRLLGRSDGTGINKKDYNDALPLLEVDQSAFKDPVSKTMKEIKDANGNLDGKGEERALSWYNQVMVAKKANDAKGDKKLSDSQFISSITEKDGPVFAPPTPSRMTQIANWAKEVTGSGQILVRNPDGQQGYIPAANVEKAIKIGYTKVE